MHKNFIVSAVYGIYIVIYIFLNFHVAGIHHEFKNIETNLNYHIHRIDI